MQSDKHHHRRDRPLGPASDFSLIPNQLILITDQRISFHDSIFPQHLHFSSSREIGSQRQPPKHQQETYVEIHVGASGKATMADGVSDDGNGNEPLVLPAPEGCTDFNPSLLSQEQNGEQSDKKRKLR